MKGFLALRKDPRHEIAKDLLFWDIPVVRLPGVADGETVETQHVCHRHQTNRGTEEVGALIGADAHQQTTITATLYHQSTNPLERKGIQQDVASMLNQWVVNVNLQFKHETKPWFKIYILGIKREVHPCQ